jgi:hypothetical protein
MQAIKRIPTRGFFKLTPTANTRLLLKYVMRIWLSCLAFKENSKGFCLVKFAEGKNKLGGFSC